MQKNIVAYNSGVVSMINQTKSLISLTDKLLCKNLVAQNDDKWMQRLWKWADEHGIDDIANDFDLFGVCSDVERLRLVEIDSKKNSSYKFNGCYTQCDFACESETLWNKIEKYKMLSDREKSVIYMRYWLRYSFAEIGAKLSTMEERAKQIFSSASTKLQLTAKNKLPRNKKELLSIKGCFLSLNANMLPEELFNLSSLELIRLHLPLKELQKDVANLKNLKDLYITSDELRRLPNALTRLENLKVLTLDATKLESLPDNIENMFSLESVSIFGSSLKKLPDGIGKMKSLKGIVICDSQIEFLPENIFDSKTLTNIYICGKLTKLPEASHWRSIDWEVNDHPRIRLDFSNNKLTTLPKSFAYLKYADINLVNNPLKITEELKKLIETMELNGCMVDI